MLQIPSLHVLQAQATFSDTQATTLWLLQVHPQLRQTSSRTWRRGLCAQSCRPRTLSS